MDDKAFLLLLDKGLFQIRVQNLNRQVPRGSPATTSSVDDHLALVGKSVSSYFVAIRDQFWSFFAWASQRSAGKVAFFVIPTTSLGSSA